MAKSGNSKMKQPYFGLKGGWLTFWITYVEASGRLLGSL